MMKKLSLSIILSMLLALSFSVTAFAEGDWVPSWYINQYGGDVYYYHGEYYTEPPTTPGTAYTYKGKQYVVGGSTQKTVDPQPQPVQPAQPSQPAQPVQPQPQPQVVKPYFYDGAWHEKMPTEGSKSFWYNGAWYTTAPTVQSTSQTTTVQRPSAYVDNTANAKAQELVNYAVSNGVSGYYSDSTDSATQAQKYLSFSGPRANFDMTLTTHIGSDGNYVTKYWRAGVERSLSDIQSWILGCK